MSPAPISVIYKSITNSSQGSRKRFAVVGLGASAGGLEALKTFFTEVPVDSGLAYIVNVHQAPKQPSLMPELLQRVTRVPVTKARNGQPIEPDHIYVVPPDKTIGIFHGQVQLFDIIDKHPMLPIDDFLKSLAQDQGSSAVAVILSGTGTDGSLGVKAIKVNDGLLLVQSEESAGYSGMPRSAIDTGLADMVLPPGKMPARLIQYFAHPHTALMEAPAATAALADAQQEWLNQIFAVLRSRTGHDFSQYKRNTLLRRISRRMGLNQVDSGGQYLRFLRQSPAEMEALFRELLIGVTSFFRDPESFEALKTHILPEIIDRLNDGATLRAWIPGCSTGEEVYSLAIVMREVLDRNHKHIHLQLFGTDIDKYAIDKARDGLFTANIATEVSEARRKRFFIKEGSMYRIRKEIRDSAIFSVQDLIKDPPFSGLHLLCCRNLLIYLEAEAQKKILPLFHYTLNPEGILVLGSSETIGGFTNLFDTLDKKWKMFRRREVPMALRQQIVFPSGPPTLENGPPTAPLHSADGGKADIAQLTQRAILERFTPTALLVDANGALLYVQGRTGKYLEATSGAPTYDVLNLAREGLRIELSSALRAAKTSRETVVRRNLAVKTNGDVQTINLHVCPLNAPRELAGRFLVIFEDTESPRPAAGKDAKPPNPAPKRIASLEKELQNTRESHQTTIEELESSNEELKSTNEELQSLNEELQTVNAELQSKVEELSASHDDMRNLLNSTEIATIFVDNDLHIRRFTPKANAIVNLIPTDIGRPLQHVVSNLAREGMLDDLNKVLTSLAPRSREVQTTTGQWFKMNIIPYRTRDNRIGGAVLTFASIDEQKQTQQRLIDASESSHEMTRAWQLVRSVFDMISDPLAVLDSEGRIDIANTAFTKEIGIAQAKVKGISLLDVQNSIPERSELAEKLRHAMEKGEDFHIDTAAPAGKESASRLKGRLPIRLPGRPAPSPSKRGKTAPGTEVRRQPRPIGLRFRGSRSMRLGGDPGGTHRQRRGDRLPPGAGGHHRPKNSQHRPAGAAQTIRP